MNRETIHEPAVFLVVYENGKHTETRTIEHPIPPVERKLVEEFGEDAEITIETDRHEFKTGLFTGVPKDFQVIGPTTIIVKKGEQIEN